jgi:hypothetical protein
MADVPKAATDAAHKAITCRIGEPGWPGLLDKSPHDLVDIALEAAAPLIAAAERERVAVGLEVAARNSAEDAYRRAAQRVRLMRDEPGSG